MDIRKLVVKKFDEGWSQRKIAKDPSISRRALQNILMLTKNISEYFQGNMEKNYVNKVIEMRVGKSLNREILAEFIWSLKRDTDFYKY